MVIRTGSAVALLLLSGCASSGGPPDASAPVGSPSASALEPAITRVTCGGGPAFELALLEQPGTAEQGDDAAAAALRGHLAAGAVEADWLPDEGWIEVTRGEATVQYVAPGGGAPFSVVTVERADGAWAIDGWAQCEVRPELPPGVGLAVFRVAPGEALAPDSVAIDVLVTEMACNSGEDARGRILPPTILSATDSLTVIMTVRPRGGGHECPSNPETPFVLQLAEPLGERVLLDGSEVPARDARVCPDGVCG